MFSIFTLYVSKILLAVIRLQKHADVLCYRDVEMGRKVWGMGALEVGLKVCVGVGVKPLKWSEKCDGKFQE